MKRIIFTNLWCFFVCILNAQITTGEMPLGLDNTKNNRNSAYNDVPTEILIARDMKTINAEDAIADAQNGFLRFAYPIEVKYTPDNSGIWQTLDDGRQQCSK